MGHHGERVTHCDECGFLYESVTGPELGAALRSNAARIGDVLVATGGRSRPAPDVWSPLEYGCHVRDVLLVQLGRVARGLAEDAPSFHPMGRDDRAERLRYSEQDLVVVREQVLDAAEGLAEVFDGLGEEHLARTVIYNWPVQAERPIQWVGQHTVHELVHHRLDIERQAQMGRARG